MYLRMGLECLLLSEDSPFELVPEEGPPESVADSEEWLEGDDDDESSNLNPLPGLFWFENTEMGRLPMQPFTEPAGKFSRRESVESMLLDAKI